MTDTTAESTTMTEAAAKALTGKAIEAWEARLQKVQTTDPEAWAEWQAFSEDERVSIYYGYVAGYMTAAMEMAAPMFGWEVN